VGNRTARVAAPEVHLGQVRKLRLLLPLHMAVAEEHVDAVDVRHLPPVPGHAREVFIVGPASRAMVVPPAIAVELEDIAHEKTSGFKAVGCQVLHRSAPDLTGIHLMRNIHTPPVSVLVLKEIVLPTCLSHAFIFVASISGHIVTPYTFSLAMLNDWR